MKETDNHIFFWGEFLSNWYPCEFVATINGKQVKFHNTEQYFMYMKAIKFGDKEIAEEILKKGDNPKIAKNLGRKVKNYDDGVWNNVRYSVMRDACFMKFSQNESLKKKLLNPKWSDKGFVEGSPYDRIWGIGVHYKDASDDESTWRGENLLGKVLNEVRELLK